MEVARTAIRAMFVACSFHPLNTHLQGSSNSSLHLFSLQCFLLFLFFLLQSSTVVLFLLFQGHPVCFKASFFFSSYSYSCSSFSFTVCYLLKRNKKYILTLRKEYQYKQQVRRLEEYLIQLVYKEMLK